EKRSLAWAPSSSQVDGEGVKAMRGRARALAIRMCFMRSCVYCSCSSDQAVAGAPVCGANFGNTTMEYILIYWIILVCSGIVSIYLGLNDNSDEKDGCRARPSPMYFRAAPHARYPGAAIREMEDPHHHGAGGEGPFALHGAGAGHRHHHPEDAQQGAPRPGAEPAGDPHCATHHSGHRGI